MESVTEANELMSPAGSFPGFSYTQPPLAAAAQTLTGQVVFTFQFYLAAIYLSLKHEEGSHSLSPY